MASKWISYNELAWTDDLFADPLEYEEEVEKYVKIINETARFPVKDVLHLGCGAGWYDKYLKKYFTVTGVDLSCGMLERAMKHNPEIEYFEGDMKNIRLNKKFDAVIIPDSIDYIVSVEELKAVIETAALHLREGGLLLITCKTKEIFNNNNFVYTGQTDDLQVTLFENNYANPHIPDTYELTLFYIIRDKGDTSTYSEHTIAGLFSEKTWDKLFKDADFKMNKVQLDGTYDNYILEDGAYSVVVFAGRKNSKTKN